MYCYPLTTVADTVTAYCALASDYRTARSASSNCTFSQRQGFISVRIGHDIQINLSPSGDTAGNYIDHNGFSAYRRSGLGSAGLIFQMHQQFLYVYWSLQRHECDAAALTAAPGCSLNWGELAFTLNATDHGSLNTLTLQATGLSTGEARFSDEIDGSAWRAEIADLDANGWPEVYTYVSSAGSGSYGSLVAYSVNQGKSLTPIYMPALDELADHADGYMGHDEFEIVENRLLRRYPIYRPDDTNSAPTGGTRQLQYQLQAGEAGWVLVLDPTAAH